MKEFWDQRYSEEEYAYGKEPNEFLKEQLTNLKPGNILLPADGEGRNGVYAAGLGWKVTSFDISSAGKDKALRLAADVGVEIDYRVGKLEDLDLAFGSFDVVALIFAHFHKEVRTGIHQDLCGLLKSGGIIILEGFSEDHLRFNSVNPEAGGPRDKNMLFGLNDIAADFAELDTLLIQKIEVEISEGKYHRGTGAVIRYVGRKL